MTATGRGGGTVRRRPRNSRWIVTAPIAGVLFAGCAAGSTPSDELQLVVDAVEMPAPSPIGMDQSIIAAARDRLIQQVRAGDIAGLAEKIGCTDLELVVVSTGDSWGMPASGMCTLTGRVRIWDVQTDDQRQSQVEQLVGEQGRDVQSDLVFGAWFVIHPSDPADRESILKALGS